MRIAALGNVGQVQTEAHTQRVGDARSAMRVGAHVLLQGAFLAPGLWVCGVRGWRLLGASLAGSVSFTLLSWLWATANGWELLPLGDVAEPKAVRAPQGGTRFAAAPAGDLPEVIDV